MSTEYRDKLRSLSFRGTPVASKVTYDHTDTTVVRTTEKNESQDIHVAVNEPVRAHRSDYVKDES